MNIYQSRDNEKSIKDLSKCRTRKTLFERLLQQLLLLLHQENGDKDVDRAGCSGTAQWSWYKTEPRESCCCSQEVLILQSRSDSLLARLDGSDISFP